MRIKLKSLWGSRAAFTLMEVNLAIFIMAVGVLAMVSLYPLGYRENQQSRDDVQAAAAADYVLGQITAVLSSRNLKWSDWKSAVESAVGETPNGWLDYMEKQGQTYVPVRNPTSKAQGVFRSLTGKYSGSGSPQMPSDTHLKYALVAQWGKLPMAKQGNSRDKGGAFYCDDASRVCISFRATRRAGALFAQPLYYTEIHFQGDQEELEK